MQEKPHAQILDRTEPEQQVKQHLARQVELLIDLADYGSNLVIRAFTSSEKKMAEVIVCGVLLKQVVAMIDATQVLLVAGCCDAALLPARAAWEASVYLDWILAGDGERRAMCYLVGNYRAERMWVDRVTPGTAEEAAFSQITKSVGLDLPATRPTLAADSAVHLAEVNRILKQPALLAIDVEFATLRGKRKRDPDWYELDGMKSIRQVSEAVGRLAEYEAFYSRGSQVMHTGTYKDHVRFTNGEVRFKTIRHLESINSLFTFAVAVAFSTYKRVLSRYRPGEIDALVKKYKEDWREPFLNAPRFDVVSP